MGDEGKVYVLPSKDEGRGDSPDMLITPRRRVNSWIAIILGRIRVNSLN